MFWQIPERGAFLIQVLLLESACSVGILLAFCMLTVQLVIEPVRLLRIIMFCENARSREGRLCYGLSQQLWNERCGVRALVFDAASAGTRCWT